MTEVQGMVKRFNAEKGYEVRHSGRGRPLLGRQSAAEGLPDCAWDGVHSSLGVLFVLGLCK